MNSLTDKDDFLYSTSDVAIWSTVETGLAITAAGVATLRPLLRTFFGGGSSAPEYDNNNNNSTRRWHRTGSAHHVEPGFDLQHRSQKGMGVTTVIDHNKSPQDIDIESNSKADARSVASDPFQQDTDWNSSDSNLAGRGKAPERTDNPWNITVKKSIVQVRT